MQRRLSPSGLRQRRVERLLIAGPAAAPGSSLRLAIFDAWRPVAVQAFMFVGTPVAVNGPRALALRPAQCEREATRERSEPASGRATQWRIPATPPPHSTARPLDLTLAEATRFPPGRMGGAKNRMRSLAVQSRITTPEACAAIQTAQAALWHHRPPCWRGDGREQGFSAASYESVAFRAMADQLWAWRSRQPNACYGRWLPRVEARASPGAARQIRSASVRALSRFWAGTVASGSPQPFQGWQPGRKAGGRTGGWPRRNCLQAWRR